MPRVKNIKGIILQPFHANCLFEGAILTKDDGSLKGALVDRWGYSKIEGKISYETDEMSFKKIYEGRNYPIFYSFRKEGSLWTGGYNSTQTGLGGAQCEIFRSRNDSKINWDYKLLHEQIDGHTLERFSKNLIDDMIKQGYFKESIDEKTGEKMIELTDLGSGLFI